MKSNQQQMTEVEQHFNILIMMDDDLLDRYNCIKFDSFTYNINAYLFYITRWGGHQRIILDYLREVAKG